MAKRQNDSQGNLDMIATEAIARAETKAAHANSGERGECRGQAERTSTSGPIDAMPLYAISIARESLRWLATRETEIRQPAGQANYERTAANSIDDAAVAAARGWRKLTSSSFADFVGARDA